MRNLKKHLEKIYRKVALRLVKAGKIKKAEPAMSTEELHGPVKERRDLLDNFLADTPAEAEQLPEHSAPGVAGDGGGGDGAGDGAEGSIVDGTAPAAGEVGDGKGSEGESGSAGVGGDGKGIEGEGAVPKDKEAAKEAEEIVVDLEHIVIDGADLQVRGN